MSSFNYDDIKFNGREQIRLFTLQPTSEEAIALSGTLIAFDWADLPAYTALSYTWGSAFPSKKILVNECEFEVTSNLYDALHELQEDKPTCLWIDAICINQQNDTEKSEQVAKMGPIFAVATSVFTWLGPAADDSDTAMDFLRRIGDAAIEAGLLKLDREIMLKLWEPDPDGLLSSVRVPFENLSKELDLDYPHLAVNKFTGRSYWERTWVVQEFSLAHDVLIACGSKRMNFSQLRAGVNFLSMHVTLVLRNTSAADRHDTVRGPALHSFIQSTKRGSGATSSLIGSRRRYQVEKPENFPSLMGLLMQFSNRLKATEAKDRIYGILGLAKDREELGIPVDYSMQTHVVYTQTARALLLQNHTDILSWCQQPKSRHGLPSWVPDFHGNLREPYGSWKWKTRPWKPLFNASKSHTVKLLPQRTTDASNTITMSGIKFDTIKNLGTVWLEPEGKDFWQPVRTFLNEIKDFIEQAKQVTSPVSNEISFWNDAFYKIPCADLSYHGFVRRRTDSTAEEGLCEVIARMYGDLSGYEDGTRNAAFARYDGAMGYLYGLKPFISAKGYVGLAPECAMPGDSLCLIVGAIVPYIMKRSSEQDGTFELIGEAYVHGVMDGEVMDLGLEEELFCLS